MRRELRQILNALHPTHMELEKWYGAYKEEIHSMARQDGKFSMPLSHDVIRSLQLIYDAKKILEKDYAHLVKEEKDEKKARARQETGGSRKGKRSPKKAHGDARDGSIGDKDPLSAVGAPKPRKRSRSKIQ